MGMLVDGRWVDERPAADKGRFIRPESQFRGVITADGSSGFRAEPGRYHLYVSLACPWAHRTLIVRALKGLRDAIGVSIVDPVRDERGWAFRAGRGATADALHGWSYLSEAYAATDASYNGRISVPVLWDTQTGADRQQRVGGHHRHAQRGVRRVYQ